MFYFYYYGVRLASESAYDYHYSHYYYRSCSIRIIISKGIIRDSLIHERSLCGVYECSARAIIAHLKFNDDSIRMYNII